MIKINGYFFIQFTVMIFSFIVSIQPVKPLDIPVLNTKKPAPPSEASVVGILCMEVFVYGGM